MVKQSDGRKSRLIRKWLIGLLVLILIAGGYTGFRVGKVVWYPQSEQRNDSVQDMGDNLYGCFRLSLLPTGDFAEGDIEYFTGIATKEVRYCFYNLKDVGDFLTEIYDSQEMVERIYLYLDPVEISKQYAGIAALYGKAYSKYLLHIMAAHPETSFAYVLPGYSVDYWNGLGVKGMQEAQSYIRDFYNVLESCGNAKVYYQGFEEWLIANKANYVDKRLLNMDVNSFLSALVIRDDYYVLTRDNLEEKLAITSQIVNDAANAEKIDLSTYDIVFLGDSVFGNYTDSMSIPGVVSGVSGARVYNCAQGGRTATYDDSDVLTFEKMVTGFIKQDVMGLEDCNYKSGVLKYMEDNHQQRKQCFIINFGLNDYFCGFAVGNPVDAVDSHTYSGALRNGISMLQEAYPDADILLMSPNLITTFENGTLVQGESGDVLEAYVKASQAVAVELDVWYLDVYHDAGYTTENAKSYLADECHPNERGRYLLAGKIMELLDAIE